MASVPQFTEEDLRRDLPEVFRDIDVNILSVMWTTTCQSETAARCGYTQGRVRHRMLRAVGRLKELALEDPARWGEYARGFTILTTGRRNYNALHEVVLPQWRREGW